MKTEFKFPQDLLTVTLNPHNVNVAALYTKDGIRVGSINCIVAEPMAAKLVELWNKDLTPAEPPAVIVVTEMVDIDLSGIHFFTDRAKADELFDHLCQENLANEAEQSDLSREAPGTLRFAGDDAYSVQMIQRPITP